MGIFQILDFSIYLKCNFKSLIWITYSKCMLILKIVNWVAGANFIFQNVLMSYRFKLILKATHFATNMASLWFQGTLVFSINLIFLLAASARRVPALWLSMTFWELKSRKITTHSWARTIGVNHTSCHVTNCNLTFIICVLAKYNGPWKMRNPKA